MPPRDKFLDDCENEIRQILQHAGVAQATIHVEKLDEIEQGRTFYIDDDEENSRKAESRDTPIYGIGSQTKLLVVLLLYIIVDKLSFSQKEKHKQYRILREYRDPWETPFTVLFNRFSPTEVLPLPRNPTLRHVVLHFNSLPSMNYILLALDGTQIMSKESFFRVGPPLAERLNGNSEDYFHYSNGNYILIGCLIEVIAKESLAAVMREHLLDPLEMKNTSMGDVTSPNTRIANPFIVSVDGSRHHVKDSLYPQDSLLSPALGACSSATDLAILMRNILACIKGQGLIFTKDDIENILRPQGILNESTDKMSFFGIRTTLGTSTPGSKSYNRLISPVNICSTYPLGREHGEKEIMAYYIAGAVKGYTCSSYLIPRRKFFVIVLTNATGRIDASDYISRLILQRFFDLRLDTGDLASLGSKIHKRELGIRLSDLRKVVDIVGMSSRMAAEAQSLLDRFVNEDTEKGISSPRPVLLDGIYHCDLIEQTIIIEGEKARIIGASDNPLYPQPEPIGFIRTGDLSIRFQSLSPTGFNIDRYDSTAWRELSFTLVLGKDANNNDRVVCLSRQLPDFIDEYRWTEGT